MARPASPRDDDNDNDDDEQRDIGARTAEEDKQIRQEIWIGRGSR